MGYFEYEVGTQRLTLSDEACRIYGIEQHQLSSWQGRALELVHAEDRARLVEAIVTAGKGDGRFDVEFRPFARTARCESCIAGARRREACRRAGCAHSAPFRTSRSCGMRKRS